jgi:putative alpha-1,2-mannosidase
MLTSSMVHVLKALLLIQLMMQSVRCVEEPEELVNMLAGSFTDGNHFSTGNTLPLTSMPWGFNNWSPQTKEGSRRTGSWWFNGNDHELTWMRCTHQPSPWIGDWGWFLFSPQISRAPDRNPRHFWEPRGAVMKPHLFDAIVAPYGIRIELAPTMHGSIVRLTFPHANSNIYAEAGDRRVCFTEAAWGASGPLTQDGKQMTFLNGRASQVSKDRMPVTGFGLHIHITTETDRHLTTTVENHGELVCFKFTGATTAGASVGGMDGRVVTLRIATSLISVEQAMVSMRRELPASASFDDIALVAKRTWNK